MKIKKSDQVLIISGKDKGRISKVLQVFPKKRKIVVESINIIKKHQRPTRSGEKGEVVEISAPFDISNVKIICTKCKKATRVGYKVAEKKKYRVCKKCGREI